VALTGAFATAATLDRMIDIDNILAVAVALGAAALFAAMAWANAHQS